MANIEWERLSDHPSPPASAPSLTAVDWMREHQDAAVERLFALLEENQAAIAALAQAWRHTRRTLELTQADLTVTEHELAAERRSRQALAEIAWRQAESEPHKQLDREL